ncbi:unnamed protein product, partial [Polarella glacialis]
DFPEFGRMWRGNAARREKHRVKLRLRLTTAGAYRTLAALTLQRFWWHHKRRKDPARTVGNRMVEMAKVDSDCKPPQVRFRRPSINDTAGRRQVAIERNEQGSKNDLSGLLTELRLLREEMDNIRQE